MQHYLPEPLQNVLQMWKIFSPTPVLPPLAFLIQSNMFVAPLQLFILKMF